MSGGDRIGEEEEEQLETTISKGLELSVAAIAEEDMVATTADVAMHLKEAADEAFDLIVPYAERPKVAAAGVYVPEGDVVTVEICEWIGYSGLLLANGITWAQENVPHLLWAFFFGLIIASAIYILKQSEEASKPINLAIIAGGALIAYAVTQMPPMPVERRQFRLCRSPWQGQIRQM